ncbi:MAG: tripartite tricarboxylate transporter permease [Thermoplasmatota archaeon]
MPGLLLLAGCALLGAAIGCLTGLIPGLHVNTMALLLLSLSGVLAGVLGGGAGGLLLVAVTVAAASMVHTFVNIIPATFLGAPEEDTALVLLPAHVLLREGRGYEAVRLSAAGSAAAVGLGFLLLIPFRLLMGPPLNGYSLMIDVVPWVLVAVALVMVGTEKSPRHVALAAGVFLLAGIYGLLLDAVPVSSPFNLPGSLLFPALVGLFGVPTLLHAMRSGPLPEQQAGEAGAEVECGLPETGRGVLAGSLVSVLPGVTAAVGTILALTGSKTWSRERVVVALSAVNTATAFFVLAVLFITGQARSGTAMVMRELVTVETWSGMLPPPACCLALAAVMVAAVVGFYVTLYLGRWAASRVTALPYPLLATASLAFILLLVVLFTFWQGVLVLLVGAVVGLLCLEVRVRRSALMGVLMVPIVVSYLA